MKRASFLFAFLTLATLLAISASSASDAQTSAPSAPSWLDDWQNPPNWARPLQIIHGGTINDDAIARYRDRCGIGGFVVNVDFANGYLRNADNWAKFVAGVKKADEAGMRLWIYDEQGWPSISAGGCVLEADPTLEALELVCDDSADVPEKFYSRASYEYTFASMDTLRTARRCPNAVDPKAGRMFVDVTHRRYREALGAELYGRVEAFFTDEPTMLGMSLLRIMTPEEREKYGVADPLDWSKKILPAVPWRADLADVYKTRFGEDLRANYASLFGGDSAKDKAVRRNFWTLIADEHTSAFFGEIRKFCEETPDGPVASGHTLLEEGMILNVPLDGNKLEVLKEFQLPGQDLLTSAPADQLNGNWSTSVFPASAAYLIGERKLMTEISDHIQRNSANPRLATIDEMNAAAGIMAANGITEFTLYYSVDGGSQFPYRNEGTHRRYADFVGRLNAVLRDATPIRPVLLYYPIEIAQEEYLPMAGTFNGASQTARMHAICDAFNGLGIALTKAQIPFIFVDDRSIRELIANGAGQKLDGSRTVRSDFEFSAIVYPVGVEKKNYDWNNKNLKEVYASDLQNWREPETIKAALADNAGSRLVLDPPTQNVSLGSFVRDGKFAFVLTCVDENGWEGTATFATSNAFSGVGSDVNVSKNGVWQVLNPDSGEIVEIESKDGEASLKLEKNQTRIVVLP